MCLWYELWNTFLHSIGTVDFVRAALIEKGQNLLQCTKAQSVLFSDRLEKSLKPKKKNGAQNSSD